MLWDRGGWNPEPGFEDVECGHEKGGAESSPERREAQGIVGAVVRIRNDDPHLVAHQAPDDWRAMSM